MHSVSMFFVADHACPRSKKQFSRHGRYLKKILCHQMDNRVVDAFFSVPVAAYPRRLPVSTVNAPSLSPMGADRRPKVLFCDFQGFPNRVTSSKKRRCGKVEKQLFFLFHVSPSSILQFFSMSAFDIRPFSMSSPLTSTLLVLLRQSFGP